MKKNMLFLVLLIGLVQCQETPSAGGAAGSALTEKKNIPLEQTRGLLLVEAGKSTLLDQVNNEVYEIKDLSGHLDSAYLQAAAPCHYPSEYVFSVLTGKFNGTGPIGLRLFEVTRVDTVSAKNPENLASLGVPFEFWCHGNEPFWSVQISNFEGGIFYENMSDGSAWFCPWIPPVITENTWTYQIPAAAGKNAAMQIKIKKGKCDDGMSEQVYEYSAELKVNGATLRGVAIKGTGKALGPLGHQNKQ